MPFRHPVVRAHQRPFESIAGAAPPAVDQRLASLFQLGIIDQYHSALAGGHRLTALKAEASERAVGPDSAPAPLCTGNVRAILDDRNRMRARDFHERVEIGERRSVVHRDDCFGASSDEPLHGDRIDACVDGADVCEDWARHAGDRSVRSCGECDRGDDYFIAGPDAECFERDLECAGARAGGDRESRAVITGECGGEFGSLAIGRGVAAPTSGSENVFELLALARSGEGARAKRLAAKDRKSRGHFQMVTKF